MKKPNIPKKTYSIYLIVLLICLSILTVTVSYLLINYLPKLQFGNVEMVWLFAIIPIAILCYIFFLYKRDALIKKFYQIERPYIPIFNMIPKMDFIKMLCFIFFTFFMILGILNPKLGNKLQKVKTKGIDVIVALDISKSMLAEDLKPNRLERAKIAIYRLIDNFRQDHVGLIVFAAQAYVQLPITSDYEASKLFLNNVNTDLLESQGTAIGKAVQLALESFDPKSNAGKVIVVITDGENHEPGLLEAVKRAKSSGALVNFIGLGSPQGAVIPVYKNGVIQDYKKDKQGSVVTTKLDEKTLKQAAQAGGGIYVRGSNTSLKLKKMLDTIRKELYVERETFIYTDFEDLFQIFIIIALLWFLPIIFLNNTKKNKIYDV